MISKQKLDLLMCKVEKNLYSKYILYDKRGKPVIYVKVLKALYGMPQSALLLYLRLVKDLQKYRIKMNP